MQTSKLPASVCDEVERLCRDFIWGSTPDARKNHLISWDKICSPKENGGLGFWTLRMVNAAYLMKFGWGILTNKDALWVMVLHFKYGCGNLTVPVMECGSRVSHLWRGIFQHWPKVEQGILWVIKNGSSVRFWQDRTNGSLGSAFLVIMQLGMYLSMNISNLFLFMQTPDGWNWQQIQQVLPPAVCSKIACICAPSNGLDDFPGWQFSVDGLFTIKSAYDLLSQASKYAPPEAIFKALWKVRIPPRIDTFSPEGSPPTSHD